MKSGRKLPPHARSVKITITCPPMLYEVGKRIWSAKGYRGPAGYFQAQIRRDANLETA